MTLVERFIEFNGWPTSRKTALICALGLAFHLLITCLTDIGYSRLPWINLRLLNWILWPWISFIALAGLISWFVDTRRHRGEWTRFLLIVPYGAFTGAAICAFGVANTALTGIFPMLVMLMALCYGTSTALFTLLYGMFVFLIVLILQYGPSQLFAPIFLDRNLDIQRDPIFVAGVQAAFFAQFAFSLTGVLLVLAARRLQDQRLQQAHEQLNRSARLIRRYIPSQLADKIVSGEHSEQFKPERAKLTVFFSDVEGFTQASDHLDPEDLASLLNLYLAEMVGIAEKHGATINQIVGDGIMAFFGAPKTSSDRDHALNAVHMAQAMQHRMLELKDAWERQGIRKPFRIRIGLNTGYASVGDYGSPGRKLYSAIGLQTNLAARIQAHCEPGKILMSHSTWALVKDNVPCIERGELPFKGVHYPVPVYEVVAS